MTEYIFVLFDFTIFYLFLLIPPYRISMDEIKRLKHISLVSRLTAEISKQTGLSDKTLAEFVLDIHGAATSTADFRQKLAEAGADFEEVLSTRWIPSFGSRCRGKTRRT